MRLDHFAIPVEDPISAAYWLMGMFPTSRFNILHEDSEWVFLELKGQKLAFVKEGVHPAHFAIHVGSEAQLREIAFRHGVYVEQPREDTLSCYVLGPERLCVEFVHYLRDFDIEET